MSHSTRRATARIDCRGVCVKRLVNGSVLGTGTATTRIVFAYAPRLKRNRYSSNRIMAPTTDMIQPAT